MSKREALFTAMRGRIFKATFTKADGSIRQAWGQLIKDDRLADHPDTVTFIDFGLGQPRRAKLDQPHEFRSGKTVFKG